MPSQVFDFNDEPDELEFDDDTNDEYVAANPEPDYDYTEIDTYGI